MTCMHFHSYSDSYCKYSKDYFFWIFPIFFDYLKWKVIPIYPLCPVNRSALWLKYGILTDEFVLITVNTIGTILSVAYCFIFMKYAVNVRSVYYQVLGCIFALLSILIYVDCWDLRQSDAIQHIGKNAFCPENILEEKKTIKCCEFEFQAM